MDVPAARGTDSKVNKRSHSTYNQSLKGHYNALTGTYQEASKLNQINTRFNLSNKFEFGHDPQGGPKSGVQSRIVSKAGNRDYSLSATDNKEKYQKRD